MIAQKEDHVHKFNIPTTEEVRLYAGVKKAIDTLKYFKCKCGKKIAYDMTRVEK